MEKLLTIEEVADRLQVHRPTVLFYITTGKLRVLRVGLHYRVDLSDLTKFIEERKK